MVTTYFIVSIYCGDCPRSQGKQSGPFLSLSLSQQPFADVNIAAMTILRYIFGLFLAFLTLIHSGKVVGQKHKG
jgi:hypothetical protein